MIKRKNNINCNTCTHNNPNVISTFRINNDNINMRNNTNTCNNMISYNNNSLGSNNNMCNNMNYNNNPLGSNNNNSYNDTDNSGCSDDSERQIIQAFRKYIKDNGFFDSDSGISSVSLAIRLAFLTDLFIFFKSKILSFNELPIIKNIITYRSQIGGTLTIANQNNNLFVKNTTVFIAGPIYETSQRYEFTTYFNPINGLLNNSTSSDPAKIFLPQLLCSSDNTIPNFVYIVPRNVHSISDFNVTVYPNTTHLTNVGIYVAVFIKRCGTPYFVISALEIIISSADIPISGSAMFSSNGVLSVNTCDTILIASGIYLTSAFNIGTVTYTGSQLGNVSFTVNQL